MPYHLQLGSIGFNYSQLGSTGPYHLQLCSLCPIIFGLAAMGLSSAAWQHGPYHLQLGSICPIVFSLVA